MPKVTQRTDHSASAADPPTKSRSTSKTKRSKSAATDPSTFPESSITVNEQVSNRNFFCFSATIHLCRLDNIRRYRALLPSAKICVFHSHQNISQARFLSFKSSKFLLNKFCRTLSGFVAYVYNEREVERAAWIKYGGPEGYKSQYFFPSCPPRPYSNLHHLFPQSRGPPPTSSSSQPTKVLPHSLQTPKTSAPYLG